MDYVEKYGKEGGRQPGALDKFEQRFPDLYQATFEKGYAAGLQKAYPKLNEQIKAFESDQKTGGLKNMNTSSTEQASSKDDVEVRARQLWDADSGLRAEFNGDLESWLAFCKAEAGGQIKILGGRVRS